MAFGLANRILYYNFVFQCPSLPLEMDSIKVRITDYGIVVSYFLQTHRSRQGLPIIFFFFMAKPSKSRTRCTRVVCFYKSQSPYNNKNETKWMWSVFKAVKLRIFFCRPFEIWVNDTLITIPLLHFSWENCGFAVKWVKWPLYFNSKNVKTVWKLKDMDLITPLRSAISSTEIFTSSYEFKYAKVV